MWENPKGFVESNKEDFDKDLLISRLNKLKLSSSWALLQSRAPFLEGPQVLSRVMNTCPSDRHFKEARGNAVLMKIFLLVGTPCPIKSIQKTASRVA